MAFLLTALAAWTVTGLRVDATFMGLIDEEDPAAQRLASLSHEFGAASGLLLVITGGEEEDRRKAAAEAVEVLRPLEPVLWAEARLDEEVLRSYGLVIAADEDFENLHGAVRRGEPVLRALSEDPTLEAGLVAINDSVISGFSARRAPEDAGEGILALTRLVELLATASERDLVEEDFRRLVPEQEQRGAMGLALRDGWLASEDGSVYVVDVRTTLDPLRADIGMGGFALIEQALAPVRTANPDLWINFSGLAAGAYQDQQNVLGKVLPLSSLTLVLVLLAFTALDRRPTTSLLVGTGLLIAVLWTFALVRLVLGYASLMSTAFGILLFGLGVDYAVHIVVRFNDERAAGVDGEQAMVVALQKTGRGVVVGAVTTMTAFILMTVADVKAGTHLGITAAMGLGCALVVMVVVLPAGLALVDQHTTARRTRLDLPVLDAIVRACLQRRGLVLGVSCVTLIAVTTQLPKFQLETDLEKLVTQDMPAMHANHIVTEAFGGSAEGVLSVHEDLESSRVKAGELELLSSVARVDGIHHIIPPDVEGRLARNRRLQPYLLTPVPVERQTVDVDALRLELERLRTAAARVVGEATFAGRVDIAEQARALKAACQTTLEAVEGSGAQLARNEYLLMGQLADGTELLLEASSLWSFDVEDLPEQIRSRYVSDKGRYVLYVYPTDHRIAWDFLKRYKAEVLSVDPQAVGTLLVVEDLLIGGMDRLPFAMGAVLLSLLIILWMDLRRLSAVLVALVPLILGGTAAVGTVIALKVPISVLMLSAFPVVFGIGIDDGVHILHRWEEAEGGDVAPAVAATGKAILFTTVTTGLGFGILFLLNHRGLAGMATLVLIGVGTCFVSSITVLPALASLTGRGRSA